MKTVFITVYLLVTSVGFGATTRMISAGDAIQAVNDGLKDFIGNNSYYTALLSFTAREAMLVNATVDAYYLVPLGPENQGASGAAIVDAGNSQIEEISIFPRPMQYLSELQALQLSGLSNGFAQLVFEPSEQTESRDFPVWQVTANGVTKYVSQSGKVFDQLTTPRPGS